MEPWADSVQVDGSEAVKAGQRKNKRKPIKRSSLAFLLQIIMHTLLDTGSSSSITCDGMRMIRNIHQIDEVIILSPKSASISGFQLNPKATIPLVRDTKIIL